jgi:hypothetical protein
MPNAEPPARTEPGTLPLSATYPGSAAAYADSAGEQWLEVSRRFPFTFAGLFIGAVSFRCLMLLRPLGEPPYPLTPRLFELMPKRAHALYICSQTISSRLPRVSHLGRGICYVPLQGKRFFIDLSGSFDAYLSKFSKKTRETMRRKIRRFTQHYDNPAPCRQYQYPEEMAEFHCLAAEVSLKTYQHRLLRAGIDTSLSFREEMIRMAADNRLRGYILFRRQMPVAYMLCQARSGDLVLGKMGFDSAFAADSPGLVLLCLALRQLFAENEFRRFDLGEGAYPYKEQMATGSIDSAEIYCFPPNLRSIAFVATHSAVASAASLLRSAVKAIGLLQGLKNVMRHGIDRRRPGVPTEE